MSAFKDHFSKQSAGYARFRPRYPAELFTWLAKVAPGRDLAWDAGTGSGQVAVELAAHFGRVVGSDPSASQIAQADAHPKVEYRVEAAEASSLEPASADVVTVAQALHWFDFARFHAEVRRVAKPGGVVAAWCYGVFRTGSAADRVLDDFYADMAPYWPPERSHIEEEYRSIPFPFVPLAAPEFAMEAEWDMERVLGYFATWSAVQRCLEATGEDPVAAVRPNLESAWGSPEGKKALKWQVHLRVGRVA